jgi:predicted XRE-type DNA-binding protein
MLDSKRFDNVWDAIETPEEAAKMKVLSELMMQLLKIIEENRWSSAEATVRLHTTREKIDDLLEHRIYRFRVDDLLEMVGALGRNINVEIEAA